MAYLALDGVSIPKGNFAFIYDATENMDLYKKFYEAEKNLKIDYMDFAHKIRMAFEAFALDEEAKKQMRDEENKGKSIVEVKEKIVSEIKKPASVMNYKNIIIGLCAGKEMDYAQVLYKYKFANNITSKDEVGRKFKAYVRFLYAFGSESSHENVSADRKYIPNKENCLRVVGSFHDFLCVYYGIDKRFDSTLVPIRDYIPVPKIIVESLGLSLEVGKSLFVKEKKGLIAYYIFSSDIDGISKGQRRDIDTINKLWEDNFEDPSNIIRQTEYISGSNGEYRFQVYALPSKPLKLTDDLISRLSIEDKLDIILGLCRGIQSIHGYDTPLYYRNISPEAFYIFEIRRKYKTLLAKFDCAKDTANDIFTVYQNVEKRMRNQNTNQFFAPEVLESHMGEGVDWEKADIYSLAKTCIYILSGEKTNIDTGMNCLSNIEVSDDLKIILLEMLAKLPTDRPDLSELIEILQSCIFR